MKNAVRNFLFFSMVLVILSCDKESNLYSDGLTLSDFEKDLKPSMSYETIVAKFGEPSADIGSGIQMDSNGQLLKSLIP
jgi:hypothetical protein